jgi:hypothetical protein
LQPANATTERLDVTAVDGFDETEDPIAALADRIAERLAARLGTRLAELAEPIAPGASEELWTARRVAAHYRVGVSFVYQHANELGCIRLGGGKCPRLRFDPAIVQARWSRVGGALPSEGRQRRRPKSRRAASSGQHNGDVLLKFDREL